VTLPQIGFLELGGVKRNMEESERLWPLGGPSAAAIEVLPKYVQRVIDVFDGVLCHLFSGNLANPCYGVAY